MLRNYPTKQIQNISSLSSKYSKEVQELNLYYLVHPSLRLHELLIWIRSGVVSKCFYYYLKKESKSHLITLYFRRKNTKKQKRKNRIRPKQRVVKRILMLPMVRIQVNCYLTLSSKILQISILQLVHFKSILFSFLTPRLDTSSLCMTTIVFSKYLNQGYITVL